MTPSDKKEDRGSKPQAGWTKTGPAQPLVVDRPEKSRAPEKCSQDQLGAESSGGARADEDTQGRAWP
jgi:hypothetical protein